MSLLLRLTSSVCDAMTSPAMPYIRVGMPKFITFNTLRQGIYNPRWRRMSSYL